jgi:hypothetical protein
MSIFRIAASNQARQIKRLGIRYQSQLIHTEFEAEREAVKHHAAGTYIHERKSPYYSKLNMTTIDAAETWKKVILFVSIPA